MKKTHVLLLLLAGACSRIPGETYFNRGSPESLLDVSSEVVNMNMASTASYEELAALVAKDPPTRVQINCRVEDTTCTKAHHLFESHSIPLETGGPEGVTLVYERVIARDCENRYIDNSINPYNLHPPTFGCSIAANMVQMVSNKKQFTNPSLMDYPDADKAVINYRVYLSPPPPPTDDGNDSLLSTISTE